MLVPALMSHLDYCNILLCGPLKHSWTHPIHLPVHWLLNVHLPMFLYRFFLCQSLHWLPNASKCISKYGPVPSMHLCPNLPIPPNTISGTHKTNCSATPWLLFPLWSPRFLPCIPHILDLTTSTHQTLSHHLNFQSNQRNRSSEKLTTCNSPASPT